MSVKYREVEHDSVQWKQEHKTKLYNRYLPATSHTFIAKPSHDNLLLDKLNLKCHNVDSQSEG